MKTTVWIARIVCLLNFVFAADLAVADAPLRPGDEIQMKLGGVPSSEISAVSGVYTIDGEGSVNLPHIGRLKIAGLAPGSAESAIEDAYKSREIYTNPNVVITMLGQTRYVNVAGEVKVPQRISFTPDLTILTSINAAGGFLPFADLRKIRLVRDNKVMIIDVNKIRANPSLDLPVQPGDRIEAPSIFQNSKNSQGNLQTADQVGPVLSAQTVPLQTKADQAHDTHQQTQQNPDLSSSQRAASETQLKQVQDKLVDAQHDADLASNQRADLETQLKEAQDKLLLAQQNADLASSQRAALETQLKETQAELLQAHQNADLASNQVAALETRLKSAEENLPSADPSVTPRSSAPPKKSRSLVDHPRTGQTLPLDEAENPESHANP